MKLKTRCYWLLLLLLLVYHITNDNQKIMVSLQRWPWPRWATYVDALQNNGSSVEMLASRQSSSLSNSWIINFVIFSCWWPSTEKIPVGLQNPVSCSHLLQKIRPISARCILHTEVAHLNRWSLATDGRSAEGIAVWASLKPVHITVYPHLSCSMVYFIFFLFFLGGTSSVLMFAASSCWW